MIGKTFLIYQLIDSCISLLFTQFTRNFAIGITDISDHKIGDHIHLRLVFGEKSVLLTECIVKEKRGSLMTIVSYDFEGDMTLILRDGIPISIAGDGAGNLYQNYLD